MNLVAPSRLRVAAASRRQHEHRSGRPVHSQARTPALHSPSSSWFQCAILESWKLSMNRPGHRIGACFGKAALKTHALQTLRDCRASPNRAKRLECVRFIGAFRPARDGPRFMAAMHDFGFVEAFHEPPVRPRRRARPRYGLGRLSSRTSRFMVPMRDERPWGLSMNHRVLPASCRRIVLSRLESRPNPKAGKPALQPRALPWIISCYAARVREAEVHGFGKT